MQHQNYLQLLIHFAYIMVFKGIRTVYTYKYSSYLVCRQLCMLMEVYGCNVLKCWYGLTYTCMFARICAVSIKKGYIWICAGKEVKMNVEELLDLWNNPQYWGIMMHLHGQILWVGAFSMAFPARHYWYIITCFISWSP